jgi:hypothetical protein
LGTFQETSPYDTRYNCIAWAAGDTTAWWQSDEREDGAYWPTPDLEPCTIEVYAAAFSTLGYVECNDGTLEAGWEKIALFAKIAGDEIECTHAARQLIDGKWTSKIGRCEDITHITLEAVHCNDYGIDFLYMRRPRAKPMCD